MNNITVKEKKLTLNEIEYTFRLDFKALLKFEERYDNAWEIFNGFLIGKNAYGCIAKILACACVDRDFTEEEFLKLLSFDFVTMQELDSIGWFLVKGVISEKKEEKEENKSPKK